MRGSNLRKFLKALDLLSKPEGVTIDELQKELEIDRRSVYRQIEFIESLDFPIYDDI
jgi:predicted DNA-binding transcriptional regulator YafY